jgi:transposase-like protein
MPNPGVYSTYLCGLELAELGTHESSSSTVKREEIEMKSRIESRVDGNDVAGERSRRKIQPAKGKRYSPAQRKEILEYAKNHSVTEAAKEFGLTETSIYDWRRAIERRGRQGGEGENADRPGEIVIEDPKQERDRKVVSMWRQHPGYGPSQIRNMLKRDGFKVGRLKTAIFSLFSCPGFEPVFPCKKARFLMLLDSKAQ